MEPARETVCDFPFKAINPPGEPACAARTIRLLLFLSTVAVKYYLGRAADVIPLADAREHDAE
jgi:hypothetical protein